MVYGMHMCAGMARTCMPDSAVYTPIMIALFVFAIITPPAPFLPCNTYTPIPYHT